MFPMKYHHGHICVFKNPIVLPTIISSVIHYNLIIKIENHTKSSNKKSCKQPIATKHTGKYAYRCINLCQNYS